MANFRWILFLIFFFFVLSCNAQITIYGKEYQVQKINKSDSLDVKNIKLTVFKDSYNLEVDSEFNQPVRFECFVDDFPNIKYGTGATKKEKNNIILTAINQCQGLLSDIDSTASLNRIEIDSAFFHAFNIQGFRYSHRTDFHKLTDRWMNVPNDTLTIANIELWSPNTIYTLAGMGFKTNFQQIIEPILIGGCSERKQIEEARIIFQSKKRVKLVFSSGILSNFLKSMELKRVR